jgi:DNA-binding NarL/FixJ family response regulator
MNPRTVMIDPEVMFRELLVPVARVQTVGVSGLGAETLPLCQAGSADLLLLAPPFPDLAPAAIVEEVRRTLPKVPILLLARYPTLALAEAMEAGARGCVFKTEPLALLLEAVEAVAMGRTFLSPAAVRLKKMELPALTSRQREVLAMIAEGLTTKAIGDRLKVSYKTVDHHRTRLMGRLDLHDLASVVRFAIRIGLAQV